MSVNKLMLLPLAGVIHFCYSKIEHCTTTEIVNYVETLLDPITDDVRKVFQITNYVILCGIICLFGIGANIINISVFVRQGFKDSINISLLGMTVIFKTAFIVETFTINVLSANLQISFISVSGLSVADLACMIAMLWSSICYNPLFHNSGLPIEPLDVMYVTAGWPHVYFNRVTSFITAFITLERCLCISMPLKVKTIITPFRTKVIIVSIFLSLMALFAPFYFVNKLEWGHNVGRNKSIVSLTFTPDRELVDSVTFFIHSVLLSSALLISVAICTIILVVKLNQKTKWRETSIAQKTSKPVTTSVKEKKVVKMITIIAAIFIVCYVPPTFIFLLMVFYPEFNVIGRLQNTLFAIWSFAIILEALNSSVNICVYFNMSSKFKVTFDEIFKNKHKNMFSRKKM